MNIFINKAELAKAIYYAEIVAEEDGRSVSAILKENSRHILKLDPKKSALSEELNLISERILNGEKEEIVYEEYVDPEALHFMIEASKSGGVKRGEILKKYLPVKEIATKMTKKIKNKLKVPVFIAFAFVFFMQYVLKNFINIMESGSIEGDFTTELWIAHHYVFIGLGILLIIAVPLMFFPQKLPKIKGLFTKINGLMAVLMVDILNSIEQSPVHIIPFLQRTFEIKGFYANKKDMEELAGILYHAKYINTFQASRIMGVVSIKRDFPLVLKSLLNEMKLELELSAELIETVIGFFSTFIIMLPTIPALYVIGSVLATIAKSAMQSM